MLDSRFRGNDETADIYYAAFNKWEMNQFVFTTTGMTFYITRIFGVCVNIYLERR